MKKIIGFSILLAMMIFVTIGCSKENPNLKEVDPKLVGKWKDKETGLYYVEFSKTFYWQYNASGVSLGFEGTAYTIGDKLYLMGDIDTWAVSGNTLTITRDDGKSIFWTKIQKFPWE